MKRHAVLIAGIFLLLMQQSILAHVTIRATGPLPPSGNATVSLVVPNERTVGTNRVVLEVPDDFLKSGGRVSRVEFPADWTVRLEKEDKPADIYAREMQARSAKGPPGPSADEQTAKGEDAAAMQEREVADEARKKWIKRVVFEGGSVPVDGFREFRLSLQLPDREGRFRFPATQVYADGKEVGWTQLVEGADHPAPSLIVGAVRTEPVWKPLIAPFASALLGLLAGFAVTRSFRVD